MRDKQTVIAELRAAMKEYQDKANAMGDAGGLQGAAVLAQCPELKERLIRLGKEAEAIGVTEEELDA